MDVSTEQDDEILLNQAFGVPSVPVSRRDTYPFSGCSALVYRLKLSIVLLNALTAHWLVDESCLRLSLLLNCWLLYVTCDGVYKNYPWREPFTVWMWRLRWSFPCFGLPSIICVLLIIIYLIDGCELPHPLLAASVGWLCCMMAWPRSREDWIREKISEDDYDQFSATRPLVLTCPGPFSLILAALRSPSLLALCVSSTLVTFFLPNWIVNIWTVLALGCLAALCCHSLPEDVGRIITVWEVEETAYARRIENSLRMVKGNLRTSGIPSEYTSRFHRLAVQVPLLQLEADILQKESRTITASRAEELEKLTTAKELRAFREVLHHYGPYTTECSIS